MTPDNQTSRARILIVEDDPSIRYLMNYYLSRYYDLELASGVDEALSMAALHSFDLVLLDINLGEVRSGIDLLDLLRQQPAYRATPMVACSAYITLGKEDRFLQKGFDACIAKPFKTEQLKETIEVMLHRAYSPAEPRLAA